MFVKDLLLRILFPFAILLFCHQISQGQQDYPLNNTTWKISLNGGVGIIMTSFTENSILISKDLEEDFEPVEKYRLSGDTIFIQYLSSFTCDSSIIGVYRYKINEDEMRFTLIEDDCKIRGEELPLLTYTKLAFTNPLSLENLARINHFSINTTADEQGNFYYTYNQNRNIKEYPTFIIYDVVGNIIRKGILKNTGMFHFLNEDDGAYFLTIFRKSGLETFRLFKLNMKNIIDIDETSPYKIYQNQGTKGVFSFENKRKNEYLPYRIYDVDGRYMQSDELKSKDRIDLSNEPGGVYFMIVGEPFNKKILKLDKKKFKVPGPKIEKFKENLPEKLSVQGEEIKFEVFDRGITEVSYYLYKPHYKATSIYKRQEEALNLTPETLAESIMSASNQAWVDYNQYAGEPKPKKPEFFERVKKRNQDKNYASLEAKLTFNYEGKRYAFIKFRLTLESFPGRNVAGCYLFVYDDNRWYRTSRIDKYGWLIFTFMEINTISLAEVFKEETLKSPYVKDFLEKITVDNKISLKLLYEEFSDLSYDKARRSAYDYFSEPSGLEGLLKN